MAYKSFNQRFPAFKWILLLAVLLALPLTLFSVQNVSTNIQQHASSGTSCNSDPTWSGIIGHNDYPMAVKFHYRFKNNCTNIQYFNLSATRPTTGWSYQYAIPGWSCSLNSQCWVGVNPKDTIDVYVTITRPRNATAGTHYISLRANGAYNTNLNASKTLSYVVIPL